MKWKANLGCITNSVKKIAYPGAINQKQNMVENNNINNNITTIMMSDDYHNNDYDINNNHNCKNQPQTQRCQHFMSAFNYNKIINQLIIEMILTSR